MARLLFDENLSPRLVTALADLFPGSVHVRDVALSRADDAEVWAFARKDGLTIVTKDGDFHQMSFMRGAPPKVVWVRVGNCTTDQMIRLIRRRSPSISDFADRAEEAILVISF